MDIFDLSFEEFEKKVDSILDDMSSEELLQELIKNGLTLDTYVKYISYIEEIENVWVHKNRTSTIEKIKSAMINNKKDMVVAA